VTFTDSWRDMLREYLLGRRTEVGTVT